MALMTANPSLYLPEDVLPQGMADGQMGALPAQMAPQPVNPAHAMTAPLGPSHDAMSSMMTAATGGAEGGAVPRGTKAAPDKMAAKSPLDQQEEHAQSRLMADYQKDADPYGSPDNHPGFMGKLLHGLSHITGGDTRRQWEENDLSKGIQGLEAEKSKEGLEGAQAGHANEETSEMPGKTASEEGLQGAQAANVQSEARDRDATAAQGPSLATAYAHAVNQALKEGRDPSADPIVQHLSDAITGLQKQTTPPPGTKTVPLQVNGRPHQVLVDERTGATIKDLGESGEKPPVTNINAANSQTEKEFSYYRNKWDKDLGTYNSQNEKLQEASGFIGSGALGDALGAIKSLSGLASGSGSGVRITQAELNSIAQARGLGGDFQAALQKFGDGRKLTPQQETQLKGILSSVQGVAAAKEKVLNQGLDDLSQAPDAKTIRKIDSQLRHVLMGGAQ